MKVFLSWSKPQSHLVAVAFREWLPKVIQECADPYVSSETIKGDVWFASITQELENARVGVVFVTPENMGEPWLNFEAGALLTKFGKRRLCPVLVGLAKTDYQGPLSNLQLTELDDANDMRRLVRAINDECQAPISDAVLDDAFGRLWPELNAPLQLKLAEERQKHSSSAVRRDADSKVDEVLEIVRSLAITGMSRRFADPGVPATNSGSLTKAIEFARSRIGLPASPRGSSEIGTLTGIEETESAGLLLIISYERNHESVTLPLEEVAFYGLPFGPD